MKISDLLIIDDYGYPTGINWKAVDSIPEMETLKKCQQSPKWHKEGNAYIHTQKVVQYMLDFINDFLNNKIFSLYAFKGFISSTHAQVLVASALFHDIGKSCTTEFKKGDWHSYGHEFESEKITRTILWDEDFKIREIICALVAMHMEPLFYNENNWFKKMQSAKARLMSIDSSYSITDLIVLKWADTMGSMQEDEKSKAKDIEYLNSIIKVTEFKNSIFADYIQLNNIVKRFNALDKTDKRTVDIVVLIGLPGAGKNYWFDHDFKNMFPDKTYAMISRDDIRINLGFCKEGEKYLGTNKEEEEVTSVFNNSIKEYIKTKDVVIINNTNLRRKYRDQYKSLVAQNGQNYYIKWTYVYVEANGLETNIKRRDGQIPHNQFPLMTRKFDWPLPEEYDDLIIVHSGWL